MDTAVSRMIRRRAVVALSALLAPTVVAVPTIVALDGLDLLVASLPILLVGVVLIVRLPENWIGWVLACIGFLYATGSAATFVAAAVSRQASVGAGVLVLAWYSEWFWVPMLYLLLVVLPLLLPSGNASMTTAMRVGVAATVIATMSAMFQRDLLTEEIARPLRNPSRVSCRMATWTSPLRWPCCWLFFVILSAWAVLSLLQRYSRARGVERQQFKIIYLGVAATVAAFVIGTTLDGMGLASPSWIANATVSITPIVILVAVTRYRLYDIDRLVARTVTYAAVSVVLVAVYVLIVVVPSLLFALESGLLVAAATLTAAAAFAPLRRRIQTMVDHRFNRARYDASQVVEEFAMRLRENLDLNSLTSDMRAIVARPCSRPEFRFGFWRSI